MVLIMVCAIIIPSLLIGLVVAIFQAATSINEQTLSFLPRLIVTLLALMLFAHWMTQMMMESWMRFVMNLVLQVSFILKMLPAYLVLLYQLVRLKQVLMPSQVLIKMMTVI